MLHVLDRAAPGACNLRDANDMTPFHLACEGGHSTWFDVSPRTRASTATFAPRVEQAGFLASRHEHAEVCRLLEQLEREDGPEEANTGDQVTMRTVDSDRGGSFAVRAGAAEEDESSACNVS